MHIIISSVPTKMQTQSRLREIEVGHPWIQFVLILEVDRQSKIFSRLERLAFWVDQLLGNYNEFVCLV